MRRNNVFKNLVFCLFFLPLFYLKPAYSETTRVVFGGFSYGTNLPEKSIFKTLGLNNEAYSINSKLRSAIQKINNDTFKIDLGDLKTQSNDPENQIVMLVALDDENIFDTIMGDVHVTNASLTFRIIFFNAFNNTLVASIPIEIRQDIQAYKRRNTLVKK